MLVLELVQVPPAVASLSVMATPSHAFVIPVMGAGAAFTVTGAVAIKPFFVNVMVAVPVATGDTIPVDPTAAIPGSLLLQVPPVVQDSVSFTPIQMA